MCIAACAVLAARRILSLSCHKELITGSTAVLKDRFVDDLDSLRVVYANPRRSLASLKADTTLIAATCAATSWREAAPFAKALLSGDTENQWSTHFETAQELADNVLPQGVPVPSRD